MELRIAKEQLTDSEVYQRVQELTQDIEVEIGLAMVALQPQMNLDVGSVLDEVAREINAGELGEGVTAVVRHPC